MKPGNRLIFSKVPIPEAETPEDEASMKLIPLALKGRVFC